jgi:hypothetical protein
LISGARSSNSLRSRGILLPSSRPPENARDHLSI